MQFEACLDQNSESTRQELNAEAQREKKNELLLNEVNKKVKLSLLLTN